MNVDNLKIGAGALSINGDDIGYTTEEGVVVSVEPDVHFHLSGKWGTTPVKASFVGQKLTVEVWMAEHVLDNLESAIGGSVQADGKLKFGGLAGREISGVVLVLTPFDGSPAWTFRNAVPSGAVDANYKVNDERIVHVTFTAMVDDGMPEEENVAYIS